MAGIKIIGLGKSQGDTVVTNDDLAKIVETSDQWIREKSGIRSRFFARKKSNADMAAEAAEKAIENAGIRKEDISLCITATFTPDDHTPSVACSAAGKLGLRENVLCLDVNGACTGFIYGCSLADGFLAREGGYGLIIGSEKISPLMDMEDRSTCVLFGDGAGAAVVEYSDSVQFAYLGGCVPSREILHCGGEKDRIVMSGQEVYRFAVSKVPECINGILNRVSLTEEDIDHFVCHQANERIIDSAARRITKNTEKFFKNLYHYGNTSAASIPIALCEMEEQGVLKSGDNAICTGFGAGLTYGSMLITFCPAKK